MKLRRCSHDMTRSCDDGTQGSDGPDGAVNPIDTDYKVGQDNILVNVGPFGLDIHNRVFAISGLLVVAFVVLTLAFQNQVEPMFTAMRGWLTSNLDWFFISAGNIFVLVCLGLAISPLGKVRLGGTEATPDYTYLGWFSMLFAAGMGIGLMFFGVSEPLSHFGSAFGGTAMENGVRTDWAPLGAAAGDAEAATRLGMAATIYHWALHPWAIYAILALGLALFSFNKGLPLTMRSVFYPLLGERVWGWPGHVIDILAVLATLFGLATSLGYGAAQASSGPELPVRRAARQHHAGRAGDRHHRDRAVLGGGRPRRGRQAPVRDQHGAGRAAAAVRDRGRARRWTSSPASSATWVPTSSTCRRCPTRSGATTPTSRRAGPPSTGRGGSRGRPSSACSSRACRAAARCASSSSRC
jgi:hypothetical protein